MMNILKDVGYLNVKQTAEILIRNLRLIKVG